MSIILRCSECGGVLEAVKNGPLSGPLDQFRVTSWWCPKCELGREVEPDEDCIITFDMHRTTVIKYLACRLVPRGGLFDLQPLKTCDTMDDATVVLRQHAACDSAYLYTVLTVVNARVK